MHHRHRSALVPLAAALGLALAPGTFAASANPARQLVEDQRALGARFVEVAPFAGAERTAMPGVLRDATRFAPRAGELTRLGVERPDALRLKLPTVSVRSRSISCGSTLHPDFAVVTSDGGTVDAHEWGVHYRGVVAGDDDSLASISVYGREIMGFVQSPRLGQLTLGRMQGDNPRDSHVLYASDALIPKSRLGCDMAAADETPTSEEELLALLDSQAFTTAETGEMATVAGTCVRIYVEADYDIYQNKGSAAAVTNYLTGLFAQSATLYANETIPIQMSQLYIWTKRSPTRATPPPSCSPASRRAEPPSTAISATWSRCAAAAASRRASTASAQRSAPTPSASA